MTFLYLISSQIIQLNGFPRAYVHRQCACLHWFIFTAMMYWHSIHWQINEIKLKACVHRECILYSHDKLIFNYFNLWNPIEWISSKACVHRECAQILASVGSEHQLVVDISESGSFPMLNPRCFVAFWPLYSLVPIGLTHPLGGKKMKQLKHVSIAVVAALLGVAISETLLLLPPKDYRQMALHNEIGESPGWSLSTSVSEKLPSYHRKNHLRAVTNNFHNLITPISSNSVEESNDSTDMREIKDFGMSSKSEVLKLDSKQKRCFVDYQLHLKALLANSTTGFDSAHKVRKKGLTQMVQKRHVFLLWIVCMVLIRI